jgi:transposase
VFILSMSKNQVLVPIVRLSVCLAKVKYKRQARHLDSFGRRSQLCISTRRWRCQLCKRSFLAQLPGLHRYKRSTQAWRESIYEQHHHGICAHTLARLHKLGSASVERIYREFTILKAKERLHLRCPQILGIDEHRIAGQARFATTFCDLKNHRVFDIVAGRSERELKEFLERLEAKEAVRVVCIDLSSPYRRLIRRYFPHAKIVADRFHVMRLIIQRFLELVRQMAPCVSNQRGLLNAWRKRLEHLNSKDKHLLATLFNHYPCLQPIYEKMHQLRCLINIKHQTQRACRKHISTLLNLIEELKQSPFKALVTLAHSLEDWKQPIAAMWRFTKNNGITEGFHRKIKLIQRRAYGFKNFHNYRLRVIALCG